MACDQEEKYESLKEEFSGNVWECHQTCPAARFLVWEPLGVQPRLSSFLIEQCTNLPKWPLRLPRQRLHHLQR